MKLKPVFWIVVPSGILLLVLGLGLALPGLVSSPHNRATIEGLASSITGRDVHISGNLSLALKPAPELSADGVTISGPNAEVVTAKSLTLDIALGALLHGELSASNLKLQSPTINFPWPLPNGAAAIAPPPWLAALHAQIEDGLINIGNFTLSHVSADIFTSAQGSLAVSGNAMVQDQPVTLSLSLGALDATATAPLTIDAKSGTMQAHLSGNFSTDDALTGHILFTATNAAWLTKNGAQPFTAAGFLQVDPRGFRVTNVLATQATAQLSGDAAFDLNAAKLELDLAGHQLDLQPIVSMQDLAALRGLTIGLHVNFDESAVAGVVLPNIQMTADVAKSGVSITALNAALPGNGRLGFNGMIGPSGRLQGTATVTASDFAEALAALRMAPALPVGWQANLVAKLDGPLDQIDVSAISGTLGPATLNGTARLQTLAGHMAINGAMHVSTLDLAPLVAALRQYKANSNVSADIELTAAHANFDKIVLTHFLIDADLSQQLVVRRLSAALYNGMIAASFTVAEGGQILSARALLNVPSAQPLAGLLPAALLPPDTVVTLPLAALIEASGPADALVTSSVITLGPFALTASPVLDFVHGAAKGPLTVRHPSAIAALKAFGWPASLAWPGAGSISLRANMAISQSYGGLTDFVLSMGDTTAAGKFTIGQDHKFTAQINADDLALPPLPSNLSNLWAGIAVADGKIDISANRVFYAGNEILGASAGLMTMQPNDVIISVAHADVGGGNMNATISATTAPATPPSLATTITLKAVNLAAVQLPITFPLTLPSGLVDAHVSLAASGFSQAAWLATLNGMGKIHVKNGSITGFNLAGLNQALSVANRAVGLRNSCETGTTPFDDLDVAGPVEHGIFKLSTAHLQSPAGAAYASGSIDMPDQAVALSLNFLAHVTSPPTIGVGIIGPWGSVHKIPDTRAGLSWQPAP